MPLSVRFLPKSDALEALGIPCPGLCAHLSEEPTAEACCLSQEEEVPIQSVGSILQTALRRTHQQMGWSASTPHALLGIVTPAQTDPRMSQMDCGCNLSPARHSAPRPGYRMGTG